MRRGRDVKTWTDGVVSYRSAHREDVTREKVVAAGHRDVILNSETVAEVRQILLEHLLQTQGRRYPVIPVRRTVDADFDTTGRAMVP